MKVLNHMLNLNNETHVVTNPKLSETINQFKPAVLAAHTYLADVKKTNKINPIHIATEQPNGTICRFETLICTTNQQWLTRSAKYIERVIKFMLWSHGATKVYIGGSPEISNTIQSIYNPTGGRNFDVAFMSKVFDAPFEVISCDLDEVPERKPSAQIIGYRFNGYRVGFDLGASDLKVSAVTDGEPIFSKEIIWNPRDQQDPDYHRTHIFEAVELAASKLPRLDAIGGSAAGVYIDNQPRVASLFRNIPEEKYHQVKNIFNDLGKKYGVPIVVINDGDVSALAGAISLNEFGVIGLAMGSSEAAGFINSEGQVTGSLNELAFAPIDVSDKAPIDEWSGDKGVGASYLSQQAAFRLAKVSGIKIDPKLSNADRLAFLQELLSMGDLSTILIWQTIGMYLGYAIAHYADFYDFKHILILGRVTSGKGGSIIVSKARTILIQDFPDLAEKITIHLPDEKSRRLGQSIVAASLPIVKR